MATAKTTTKKLPVKKALLIPEGGIQPGHEVRDIVTGYTGIVTSKTEFLNGCVRLAVLKSNLTKDGDIAPDNVFDVQQLEYLGTGVRKRVQENSVSVNLAEAKSTAVPFTGGDRHRGSAVQRSVPRR